MVGAGVVGEPLKVVQELLGHANIEATMIYAHLSESRLKQAVAKLDEPAPSGQTWLGSNADGTEGEYESLAIVRWS